MAALKLKHHAGTLRWSSSSIVAGAAGGAEEELLFVIFCSVEVTDFAVGCVCVGFWFVAKEK
jgi:hypothetical protein